MKGWKKLESFDKPFQAELRKNFLEAYDIPVVLMNEKDSTFLFGDVDLYVEEHLAEKAQVVIEEFKGWSKLHSFIREAPILLLKSILDANQIKNHLLQDCDTYSETIDYQLFVKNKDLQKAVECTMGLEDWAYLCTLGTSQQAAYRVDILAKENIEPIVYRISDSNFEAKEYNLFVKNDALILARNLVDNLVGWQKIKSCRNFELAEYYANLLEHKQIKVIVTREKSKDSNERHFDIFVETENTQQAEEIIENKSKWKIVATYETLMEAELAKELLTQNNIESFVINQKDCSFLIGELDLYVEESSEEEASELIKKMNEIE